MNKALFITATDTGVGKTTVSAAIAKILKESGINVAYFKPIETGVKEYPADGRILTSITGQSIDEAVLYTFKNPLAPYPASKLEKKDVHIDKIIQHYNKLKDSYDFLIVEGAGGVYVPIVKGYTYIDLIKDLNIPILIVSRAKLGTINHTVLTVKALKGLKISGIVMNGFNCSDNLEKTNLDIIQEMTSLDIIAKCYKSKTPIEECYKRLKDTKLINNIKDFHKQKVKNS